MESTLINIGFVFYVAAVILYGIFLFGGINRIKRFATMALSSGFLLTLIAYIIRWQEAKRLPLSNMYESMFLFTLSLVFFYVIFEFKYKFNKIGFISSILALLLSSYLSFLGDSSIEPLVPALQSNWLTAHVVTYFIAYGALTISLITAIIALFPNPREKDRINFSNVTYRIISFAFPFLMMGLITGAVWAKQAWGDYWSWDPKETWSLITLFIYINYLHLPYTMRSALKKAVPNKSREDLLINIFAIVGYFAVVFTYFGVNYLLAGLHSYTN